MKTTRRSLFAWLAVAPLAVLTAIRAKPRLMQGCSGWRHVYLKSDGTAITTDHVGDYGYRTSSFLMERGEVVPFYQCGDTFTWKK